MADKKAEKNEVVIDFTDEQREQIKKVAGNKVVITLTEEQRQQIKKQTGRLFTELRLTSQELELNLTITT